MTEDLVRSSSSQRSNPRVLRRVRPVPYECCGGACSFLNSGCFTLCCNGRNTRRRSSVYVPRAQKEEEIQQEDEGRGQLSETTKRLIKPYSQDALNEDDLYVLEREFESECSDESTKKQNFVTSFDIDDAPPPFRAESEEFLREEKVDREDEISVLTDDTSASAGDGSAKKKKKKKKILNILKIGRTKRKNKDGVSVTSSATSLACSEISDGNVEDLKVASTILEKTELSQSANGEKEKNDEVTPTQIGMAKEKGSFISRSLLSIFPSMRSKKGKKNDQINDDSKTDENHDSNVQKVIPLGFGVPPKTEDPPQRDLEVNLQMKPFWKTFSKRYKKKAKNEANKEIVYGIKPEDKKNQSNLEVGSDALKIFGPDTTKTEAQKVEPKKKTLLETLKITKRDEHPPGQQNDQQKRSQIPCILSACVNSDIKPEDARRNSSDSIEVKTIVDGDLENDGNTIRIVRNEFFPTEVRTTDHHLASPDAGLEVVDKVETEVEEVDEDQIVSEDVEEIEQLVVDFQEKLENLQDSLVSVKKYEVFEKEDFSESLHTLVDEEDKDHILLAPASAITEILTIQDLQEEKSEEDDKPEADESNLPEGIFRSSCKLSIEGSKLILDSELEGKTEEAVVCPESNQEGINELEEKCVDLLEPQPEDVEESNIAVPSVENIISSRETLIETDVIAIEKSSETTQNPERLSETTSWVEVANVEDLNDSQFDYIYKTTLKAVQNAGSFEVEQEGTTENIEDSSPNDEARDEVDTEEVPNKLCSKEMEISCEVCGKSVQEEESKDNPGKTKCVCTTLTKPRQSLTEIEEGSVKSKVEALNKSKQPIIVPLSPVEFAKKDDVTISEAHSSPTLGSKSKSATPSPIAAKSRSGTLSSTNSEWQNPEEDIDRMIHSRGSLSGLGLRSDSMASVYSGAGEGRYGTVAVRGQVEFGLQYNYKAGALEIHVKQCKDLAPVDTKRNRSDPYVKVYLLPDKSKGGKRKTKVKKHTLNPVFDETLKFHISLNGLETRTLWLTVWHSDMFGRNDFLGEVMMALENKVFDDPAPVWYNLQERTEPFDDTISFKGDIIVCLKFVPPDMTVQKKGKRSRGTLHVLVKEAKYLTAYKANGTSDPFCKSYLLPDKGRNSKQKTPVVKKTVNPVWNHTFIYEDVTLQELAERCLELTVWDHDRLASNEFLGGVRFSLGTGKHYGKPVEWMDATGKELTLWKSMLERPNFWVEGCLSLRPSLDARTS